MRWNKEKREKYAQNMGTAYIGYGGVVFCPKCGKKGYKVFKATINRNIGVEYGVYTIIMHQHTELGKTVNDGDCYLGMGRL